MWRFSQNRRALASYIILLDGVPCRDMDFDMTTNLIFPGTNFLKRSSPDVMWYLNTTMKCIVLQLRTWNWLCCTVYQLPRFLVRRGTLVSWHWFWRGPWAVPWCVCMGVRVCACVLVSEWVCSSRKVRVMMIREREDTEEEEKGPEGEEGERSDREREDTSGQSLMWWSSPQLKQAIPILRRLLSSLSPTTSTQNGSRYTWPYLHTVSRDTSQDVQQTHSIARHFQGGRKLSYLGGNFRQFRIKKCPCPQDIIDIMPQSQ